jgi:hypothetical protein
LDDEDDSAAVLASSPASLGKWPTQPAAAAITEAAPPASAQEAGAVAALAAVTWTATPTPSSRHATTAEPSSPPRFVSSRHPRWHQRRGAEHGEPFGVIAQNASHHQYPAVAAASAAASAAAASDAVGRTVSSRDQGGPRAVWRERSWGREMLDGCQSFAVALVIDKRRRGRE